MRCYSGYSAAVSDRDAVPILLDVVSGGIASTQQADGNHGNNFEYEEL